MLSATSIGVQRIGQTVLESVSLSVDAGSRLGVVGSNGAGKSTLLRVLSGDLTPTSGRVERAPASLRVARLAQETDALPGESILDYLTRRTGVADATAELDRLTEEMAADPALIDAYSASLERFLALGGDDFEARAGRTLAEVGLREHDRLPAVTELSGGESARVRLAAIILVRADVLLLDEPTNDLDFAGLDLLEKTIAGFPGAVVVVSHDRAFLDRSVERILEIDEHSHTSREFAGAWSEFVERRALARSQAGAAYEDWKAERSRLSERIRSQRSWSEQGVRRAQKKPKDNDRAQRGFVVNRTEKQASKVRSSERALERLGTVDKPWEGWQLHLDLAPTERSGDVVVRLSGAEVHRPGWSFGPLDLEIGWAERVVITGSNGSGKSTLLSAVLGETALDAGTVWRGPSVRFGRLDQTRSGGASGEREASVIDAFATTTGLSIEEGRSLLAKFGLTADHVARRPSALSPGERTRLQLAELMARGTNCLVLDEPTNHLDLAAIEQLEEALGSFQGTLLLVTHDRWLLESVDFDRRLEMEGGRLVADESLS